MKVRRFLSPSRWLPSLRARARNLKRETITLYLAYRDPRTPWYAKAFALLVVIYAVSPIDLIPDFIPVVGYLDDLVLVPLGIFFAVRMIPHDVLRDCRARADATVRDIGRLKTAAIVAVMAVWGMALAGVAVLLYRILG